MNETQAKGYVDYVFKDVFGKPNPFTMSEILEKFAFGLDIPRKVKDDRTGGSTWTTSSGAPKFMSQANLLIDSKKNVWAKEKKPLKSMADISKYWEEIGYFSGEKMLNSNEIAESDNVYGSNFIFRSAKIHDSEKCVFSNNLLGCKYAVGCSYSDNTVSCMRVIDSANVTSSFAVNWSKKISRCFYINDCEDLYECMFCSNINSAKYCVANTQLTKEQYAPLKAQVIEWTIKSFGKSNSQGFED